MNQPLAAARPREGWVGSLAIAAALVLAACFSVLRKGFQFDGVFADDQFWNALLIDRLHPGMLAGDPLVALIRDGYQSGLFDAMVPLAAVVELPVLAFALFALARLATCLAFFALARTLTGSTATGLASAFLIAGASISYFGGVNFVETILTPRGFALPLGLFALDAVLRRRAVPATAWLAACLYVHPVTGVNLLGVVIFCEIVFRPESARRAFAGGLALLVLEVLVLAGRSGGTALGEAAWRFDAAWADVIAATVGPWVYLHRLPAAFALACSWVLLFGAASVAAFGTPPLRRSFVRFGVAGAAALLLHAIAVDVLQIRIALQLAPQRATLAVAAVAVVAVAHGAVASIRNEDPARRLLGVAFLSAAVLLRDTGPALVFGVLLAVAWWLPQLAPRTRLALAGVALAAFAGIAAPALRDSFHLRPARVAAAMSRLRDAGVDTDWARMQRHIREHSEPGEPVMAPPALSPRVFALRPSTLRMKMQSFTYWSRPFAFEFDAWRRAVGLPLRSADTRRAVALARASGARWLVLDERDTPDRPGDPAPAFRAGPYRAFSVEPRASAGAAAADPRVANPTR